MILQHRKRLLKLMAIENVSQRKLAEVAGYKSHAYMGRLLRGDVKTLEPEAGLRIANFLDVPVESLFLVRVSSNSAHSAQQEGSAA